MQPPDQEEKRSMNNLMVIDGIEVRRDAYGRYSLNDLHRAAGSLDKHKP
ncbi:KilA-N domain-containing protein, partial [Escherichia coli]|nr:KilA-N domain-containing protein [Escherichia coli]